MHIFFTHLFIENIRNIEVYNTLKFWKTETETDNHVIYTHEESNMSSTSSDDNMDKPQISDRGYSLFISVTNAEGI